MDNFKFNFLSRGQLESLSFDKFLLTGFKTITSHQVFLVPVTFLPLLLDCCVEIILIIEIFKNSMFIIIVQVVRDSNLDKKPFTGTK